MYQKVSNLPLLAIGIEKSEFDHRVIEPNFSSGQNASKEIEIDDDQMYQKISNLP